MPHGVLRFTFYVLRFTTPSQAHLRHHDAQEDERAAEEAAPPEALLEEPGREERREDRLERQDDRAVDRGHAPLRPRPAQKRQDRGHASKIDDTPDKASSPGNRPRFEQRDGEQLHRRKPQEE